MVSKVESMTNNQKIAIVISCSFTLLLLYSIGKYWYADTLYARGQRDYQFFQKTQDTQYLISSFQSLQSAIKLNPSEPAILADYAVGAAYLSSAVDTKDLAVAAATRAVSLSPHHPNYYKSAARVYILLSDLPSAAEVLLQATKISPTDPRIPYNLGLIYESLNQQDLAKQFYEKSLLLKPDFPDAHKALEERK